MIYLIRTPIDRRNDWVNASVLLISNENISLPDMAVNGVSEPNACAIPKRSQCPSQSVFDRGVKLTHSNRSFACTRLTGNE